MPFALFQPYLVLLGLLLAGASDNPGATRVARAPLPEEPVLAVTTFNLNYARSGDASTLAAIAEAPAELIFLQETNRAWQGQVQLRLARIFPYQTWIEGARAGGQAVLSRRPFSAPQVIASPVGWFPALRVVVETPLGKIQVLAVHLHPQISEGGSWLIGPFTTDVARLAEIIRYTAALQPLPTLIVGDFNEGTGGAALRFLDTRGYRSALPEFSPAAMTWHWPLGFLQLTGQLDHLLYDAWFVPLSASVSRSGHSDHFPVRALFGRAKGDPVPRAPHGASLKLGLAR
jgi:endonuclease/exonuclease/phosphatase family metal-dependent hydrolase